MVSEAGKLDRDTQVFPLYRQRLTLAGWIGVLFAMLMPIIAGLFYISFWEHWIANSEGEMIVAGICTLIASFAAMSGLVMILVGREYYVAKIENLR